MYHKNKKEEKFEISEKLKRKLEKEIWDGDDAWEVALEFDPLIRKKAGNYAENGAEFDDLFQEGRMAAYRLALGCKEHKLLPAYMERSLRWLIKQAARKMQWPEQVVQLDLHVGDVSPRSLAEAGMDDSCALAILGFANRDDLTARDTTERNELKAALRAALTEAEYQLVMLFWYGYTRSETAAMLGITRQALEKRLKKIGKKVRPVLDAFMQSR